MVQATAPNITTVPIRIDTGSVDTDGRLVLAGGRLVAVLVRLGDETHIDTHNSWFLEAGFGALSGEAQVFRTVEHAVDWIGRRLATA
ncbi:MAG TPA: hypothetical protein VGD08_09795 [Stellaceae bacterium]|jgi:hypothetical protein